MQDAIAARSENSISFNFAKFGERAYWGFFLISIMLKCVYFQFTTQANTVPLFSADNIRMFISSFSIILIATSILFVIFNRKRNIALFVANILLIIVLVADTNFYRYYYNAITIPVFYQFNVDMVGSVNSSIMSLFKLKDIVYLADIPIFLAMLIFISKNSSGIKDIRFTKRLTIGIAVCLIAATGFLGAYKKADNKSFYRDNNYVVKNMGIFYFHFFDAKGFIEEWMDENKELSAEEKKLVGSFYENKQKAKEENPSVNYKGVAAGKNLMVIQIEAMQGFVINRSVKGREITPNLNKLIRESMYFDNIYYQVSGGNTSDAEFLSNTSMYPMGEGSVYHRFPENRYFSTAGLLKEKGYDTYACHAFFPTFWNRNVMYKALSFDRFLNQEDYVLDDFAGWDGASALSDISFFRQTLDKIDTSKPFYSFLVTLSSHHPFEYFKDYDFDTGEIEGTYLSNYIKAANYADKSIGVLIDELKRRGLYDDTLMVFYGDHSAVPKLQGQELFDFLGQELNPVSWVKQQKVPLIFHWAGLEKGQTLNITGGQIDILPTIANLMGFDVPYALGKDLLNSKEGYAVLRNSSVITDDFVYVNDLREAYDIHTDEMMDREEYRERLDELIKQLDVSDTIIFRDAFSSVGTKK